MLYFGGIQGKAWHPHYQIALKRHSSFEKGNTRNKRWLVNKPSHVAAGILSYFTAKGRFWIMYSHRFQLWWYFLVAEGTGSALLGMTAQREADNTADTGLSQFSPRSLCNKPQDFTITTRRHWESHKVTKRLSYLQKLFMQALCLWNSRTINLVTAQCVTTHPLCCEPGLCVRGHSRSKDTDTQSLPQCNCFLYSGVQAGMCFKDCKFLPINYFCPLWTLC